MRKAVKDLYDVFYFDSQEVMPTRWQGREVSNPAGLMREMLHVNFEAKLVGENIHEYANRIQPNIPWADDHFQERVCGHPINPGVEWANWPWGVNAEKSLDGNGMFNHNYMERYWPKYAGIHGPRPTRTIKDMNIPESAYPMQGIRHEYGDLWGLVAVLAAEPDTRQAYLPIWFPEDTGDAHNGRKPCTLGYHFIMRNGELDVVYYLRSCDLHNHFRDDIYLTVRLLLWILDNCRNLNPEVWRDVKPGKIVVQITSLHMFINDFNKEYHSGPL